jgi:hypothetical protein
MLDFLIYLHPFSIFILIEIKKKILQDEGDVDLEAGHRGRRRRLKKLKGQNKEGLPRRRNQLKRKRLQGNKGRRARPRNEDQEAEAIEE